MSYCVNCGVELDDTAAFCPLCHTPVNNPNQPVDHTSPKPFPTERKEVPPVSRIHLAILLSTVLVSVAVCCGVLNLFLRTQRTWSLYVIGAAVMLWIWLVLPLLRRKKDTLGLQLLADILAIAIYVSFIAVELDGWDWYWHHPAAGGGLSVLGPDHGPGTAEHPEFHGAGHRVHRGLPVRGRMFCRPVFSGQLDPRLVPGGPGHLPDPHRSPGGSAAYTLPAGGGPAPVSSVRTL